MGASRGQKPRLRTTTARKGSTIRILKLEIPLFTRGDRPRPEQLAWSVNSGEVILRFASRYHFEILSQVAHRSKGGQTTTMEDMLVICVNAPREQRSKLLKVKRSIWNFWNGIRQGYTGKRLWFRVLNRTGSTLSLECLGFLSHLFPKARTVNANPVFTLGVPPEKIHFVGCNDGSWVSQYFHWATEQPSLHQIPFYVDPFTHDFRHNVQKDEPPAEVPLRLFENPNALKMYARPGTRKSPCFPTLAGGSEETDFSQCRLLDEVESPERRIVIVGQRGSGKSSGLQAVFAKMLDRHACDSASNPLPVLLYPRPYGDDPNLQFLHQMKACCDCPPQSIPEAAATVPIALLFDGIEETPIPDGRTLEAHIKDVLGLAAVRGVKRVMISCRSEDWLSSHVGGEGAAVREILPFTGECDGQIAAYVQQRLDSKGAHQLMSVFEFESRLAQLAGNPESLATICELIEGGMPPTKLPRNQCLLIRKCIDGRLKRRKIPSPARKLRLLYRIAYDILDALALGIDIGKNYQAGDKEELFLEALSAAYKIGLIDTPPGSGGAQYVRFIRRTYLEYCASQRIREMLLDPKEAHKTIERLLEFTCCDEALLLAMESLGHASSVENCMDALLLLDPYIAAAALGRCRPLDDAVKPSLSARLSELLAQHPRNQILRYQALVDCLCRIDGPDAMDVLLREIANGKIDDSCVEVDWHAISLDRKLVLFRRIEAIGHPGLTEFARFARMDLVPTAGDADDKSRHRMVVNCMDVHEGEPANAIREEISILGIAELPALLRAALASPLGHTRAKYLFQVLRRYGGPDQMIETAEIFRDTSIPNDLRYSAARSFFDYYYDCWGRELRLRLAVAALKTYERGRLVAWAEQTAHEIVSKVNGRYPDSAELRELDEAVSEILYPPLRASNSGGGEHLGIAIDKATCRTVSALAPALRSILWLSEQKAEILGVRSTSEEWVMLWDLYETAGKSGTEGLAIFFSLAALDASRTLDALEGRESGHDLLVVLKRLGPSVEVLSATWVGMIFDELESRSAEKCRGFAELLGYVPRTMETDQRLARILGLCGDDKLGVLVPQLRPWPGGAVHSLLKSRLASAVDEELRRDLQQALALVGDPLGIQDLVKHLPGELRPFVYEKLLPVVESEGFVRLVNDVYRRRREYGLEELRWMLAGVVIALPDHSRKEAVDFFGKNCQEEVRCAMFEQLRTSLGRRYFQLRGME